MLRLLLLAAVLDIFITKALFFVHVVLFVCWPFMAAVLLLHSTHITHGVFKGFNIAFWGTMLLVLGELVLVSVDIGDSFNYALTLLK